ncbi:MAG: hypothetical protein ACRDF7_03050 [Candidatus Limnocylindrales bacterium]
MLTQPVLCAECGAPLEAGRTECATCGAPVAPAVVATADEEAADPPASPAPVHQAALTIERRPVPNNERGVNAWYSTTAPMPPAAGRAGLLSDMPVQFPRTRGGALAVTGLLVAAVSLLLPWAPVADFISYFDAWGLGRPSTIAAFVAAIILLVIAIEPVLLTLRTRTGWLPIIFGAFAMGMAWSRIDGGLDNIDIGGWLFAVGGALAVIGGLVVLNGGGEQPVTG